jgi:hypothetical protein
MTESSHFHTMRYQPRLLRCLRMQFNYFLKCFLFRNTLKYIFYFLKNYFLYEHFKTI